MVSSEQKEIIINGGNNAYSGEFTPPGDKSISHRAVMISALAMGNSTIKGFLKSADCFNTLSAVRAIGVDYEFDDDVLKISGVPCGGFREPDEVLNMGNSGTTARLFSGVLAACKFLAFLTGDAYLRKRPMGRIVKPLVKMGATILARGGNNYLPMAIKGGSLQALDYVSPIASAQVKSCVLLAGLFAEGYTSVKEPYKSRDHTERMLPLFGVEVDCDSKMVGIMGRQNLRAACIEIPGDISSAAFFIVGALINPGSCLIVKDVGINPTRIGIIDILRRMGGRIEIENRHVLGNEPVADIVVEYSNLQGTTVVPEEIPKTIDEFPALCVAASCAEGKTVIKGAKELRYKESDRISSMAAGLRKMGIDIVEFEDGVEIYGKEQLAGCVCCSYGDHRVAMALSIAATKARGTTVIKDIECVQTSYPRFFDSLAALTKPNLFS